MNINKFLVSNSNGQKSLTATAFIIGFLVINVKLLLAGNTFGDVILSEFSGVDYAAALTALGGVYVLRRKQITEEVSNAE